MEPEINYHNKQFRVVFNSSAGEVDAGLVFTYRQNRHILTCSYAGGTILQGFILGKIDPANGNLDFVYQQINSAGVLSSGTCHSVPKVLPSGKLQLYESWKWTFGRSGKGTSILEEI
ncbi:n-acetylglutamate synthase [Ascidiimonas aurantiaca]|uniref:n-acetylglutamate synthase n=1 Tax=Ascidiimonas aurantiaca TaxID=1685432 RepID=UPI0030EF8B5C